MPAQRSIDKGPSTQKKFLACSVTTLVLLLVVQLDIDDSITSFTFREGLFLSATAKTPKRNNITSLFYQNPDPSATTFRLHPNMLPGDGPLRNATMGMSYRCTINEQRSKHLGAPFQVPGLFDFATSVRSDLGLLFIGDSVAQQLSEAYDESLGIQESWIHSKNATHLSETGIRHRALIWSGGGYKETLSLSAPSRGGGFSAYFRITDVWTEENKNKPLPQAKGGGWNDLEIEKLFDRISTTAAPGRTTFDAVVVNYNNWILPIDPTGVEKKYWDAINLAKKIAKAKLVILVTYPSTRRTNSTNLAAWRNIHAVNEMLRNISSTNNQISENPLTLVLEFGNFTNQILWLNARNLGLLNVSDPYEVASTPDWELRDNIATLFQRFKVCAGDGCLHMPMVCNEYADEKSDCIRNIISYDDTHWCTETIGARFSAGVACLLGCAFNKCNGDNTTKRILSCERTCNELFMSLQPVHLHLMNGSWISAC